MGPSSNCKAVVGRSPIQLSSAARLCVGSHHTALQLQVESRGCRARVSIQQGSAVGGCNALDVNLSDLETVYPQKDLRIDI